MLVSGQGKTLTKGQRWWRERKLPEIEGLAYALIRKHESQHGKLPGCVVQPEILLPTVGCELVYFDDAERADYGIPRDAIGALRPHERRVFIYQKIGSAGREGQTVGEEIGHFLLQARGVAAIGLGLPEDT